MLKRLTSLLILLAVGAGVASGMPTHSGGGECPMEASMVMMDCCKRARSHGNTPEVQAARLCCAFNCQGEGAARVDPEVKVSAPQVAPSHPAAGTATAAFTVPHERRRAPSSHANESPPVYLLNLTFLI